MLRILLASFLSAIVLMIWGYVAWTVLHFHDSSFQSIPYDNKIADELKVAIPESGAYIFPGMPEETTEDFMEEYKSQHRAGPVFTVFIMKNGTEFMAPSVFIKGFVIFFIASLLIAFLLNWTVDRFSGYLQRVLFVVLVSVFAGVISYFSDWAWLHFPIDYTIMRFLDLVISFFLAGLVIAAIVKPQHKYSV